jgi:tRNA A37 threonylcarbamoyladenosine dehydratase
MLYNIFITVLEEIMTENWLDRQNALIGNEATEKLKNASVMIFGIGGVGSFASEATVRAGVGKVIFVDGDTVSLTNINRQLIADTTTVGQSKAEIMARRAKLINPDCEAIAEQVFVDASNCYELLDKHRPDFIIDCIDTVSSKLLIIKWATDNGVKIISSMGTGNKLDPSKLQITDVKKTAVCPLARVMRRELKNMGISSLPVLFSTEDPVRTGERVPASISFVPSSAGLMMAGYVIRELIK